VVRPGLIYPLDLPICIFAVNQVVDVIILVTWNYILYQVDLFSFIALQYLTQSIVELITHLGGVHVRFLELLRL
jgi:hypothetical protein